MAVTIAAAWLVASESSARRNVGFWVFLASNVLWVVWGFIASAYALIVLQIALAAMNIRGAVKSEKAAEREEEEKDMPAGNADRTSSASSSVS